jgi:hypothetical protein
VHLFSQLDPVVPPHDGDAHEADECVHPLRHLALEDILPTDPETIMLSAIETRSRITDPNTNFLDKKWSKLPNLKSKSIGENI